MGTPYPRILVQLGKFDFYLLLLEANPRNKMPTNIVIHEYEPHELIKFLLYAKNYLAEKLLFEKGKNRFQTCMVYFKCAQKTYLL